MTDHSTEVTYLVEARDEFRAQPGGTLADPDNNMSRYNYERLSNWKLTYEDAHGNGMEMLALGASSFTVQKRVTRTNGPVQ